MNKELLQDIKKTTVFIGQIWIDWKETFYWTWVLVQINNVFYMLTAKHVLYKTNDSWEIISENTGLLVFLNQNTNETPVKVISLDSMKNEWYKYIAHKNASIDLAMIPIRLELEKDDVK